MPIINGPTISEGAEKRRPRRTQIGISHIEKSKGVRCRPFMSGIGSGLPLCKSKAYRDDERTPLQA